MKVKIANIGDGESGIVSLTNGSVTLSASKRSVLLKGIKLEKGDEFELTLKSIKKVKKKTLK